jgi:hypothetical protein
MILTAQLVVTLLKQFLGKMEAPGNPEQLEIIAHAENDVPQPQLLVAFGFSNSNPE